MRLNINLATQPYEDAGRFWRRWGLLLAGMSLLTLVLLYFAVLGWIMGSKDRSLIEQREQQITARDHERASAQAVLNRPDNRMIRDRSAFLNELFQRKAFSWTKVFEDLERVMPPRLHVVSIRPELASTNELQIKLVVAGDTRQHALDLVKKMEGSPHFRDTRIDQETALSGQQTGDDIQFDISALYVPVVETAGHAGAH
jgi:type IV pilus assembly protein PilN